MNTDSAEKPTVSVFTQKKLSAHTYINPSLTELKTVILKRNSLNDHTLLVLQNTVIIIII